MTISQAGSNGNSNSRRKTDPLKQQSSAERLVRALKEELAQTNDGRLQPMIERARDRVYDHFHGRLQYPRRTLCMEFSALGHIAMANRAQAGEFDPTADETRGFVESTEGQAILAQLMRVTTKVLMPYNQERMSGLIEEAARLARLRRAVSQHRHG